LRRFLMTEPTTDLSTDGCSSGRARDQHPAGGPQDRASLSALRRGAEPRTVPGRV